MCNGYTKFVRKMCMLYTIMGGKILLSDYFLSGFLFKSVIGLKIVLSIF